MGHYGQQSPELVKNYALNLGFEYMSASNKETYLEKYEHFLCPELLDKPVLFEVFTNYQDESEALCRINHIVDDNPPVPTTIEVVKNKAKELLGDKKVEAIKHLLR